VAYLSSTLRLQKILHLLALNRLAALQVMHALCIIFVDAASMTLEIKNEYRCSVVMPAFNASATIAQSIESALKPDRTAVKNFGSERRFDG
jgi:hypothetical protein